MKQKVIRNLLKAGKAGFRGYKQVQSKPRMGPGDFLAIGGAVGGAIGFGTGAWQGVQFAAGAINWNPRLEKKLKKKHRR